ncbi:hypothetical protein [Bradyrhizobium sp.]|uniref:hypothetical protein n=1 Tax=Bradyrhizobium sp. TaxID=376 RepID=UPI002729AD28|nr:hypothetical protein [Bradyrhizobium sp.]
MQGIVMKTPDQLPPHTVTDLSAEYLPLSEAVNRLSEGMWGGLPRPDPVVLVKQSNEKLSVGFGPWREKAGRLLRVAAVKGKLAIYVLAKNQIRSGGHDLTLDASAMPEPASVPASVIERLIRSRGSLPDHPIRPSMQTAEGNEKLFVMLTVGLLVVQASDFEGWYHSERAKGRWPSQRAKTKKNGRPTRQTEALENAILALVNDLKWSGKDGIAALHRLLITSGRSDVPSQDTVARLVDQLHSKTGDMKLLRVPRARQKQTR